MLYLDSSALLKHYVQEPGTDALNLKIREVSAAGELICVSVVGFAEIFATFARLEREHLLPKRKCDLLQQTFKADWSTKLSQVELSSQVLAFIPILVNKHPLRGADALHLASALWLQDAAGVGNVPGLGQGNVRFATSDKQLKTAAALEGLSVFDPQNP